MQLQVSSIVEPINTIMLNICITWMSLISYNWSETGRTRNRAVVDLWCTALDCWTYRQTSDQQWLYSTWRHRCVCSEFSRMDCVSVGHFTHRGRSIVGQSSAEIRWAHLICHKLNFAISPVSEFFFAKVICVRMFAKFGLTRVDKNDGCLRSTAFIAPRGYEQTWS